MSSGLTSSDPQFNLNRLIPEIAGSYEFGRFRLDSIRLMLYKDSHPVDLAPKVVETLLALIERSGQIVSKAELMDRLWANSFVEESNLTQNIYLLRKTLGTMPDGTPMIETFRRRGYRFNGAPGRIGDESDVIVAFQTRTRHVEEELITDARAEPRRSGSIIVRSRKLVLFAVLACAMVFLVSWVAWRELRPANRAFAPSVFSLPEMRRLVPDVDAKDPTISPDGKYLVFGRGEPDGKRSMYLLDLVSGAGKEILPPTAGGYDSFVFSSDGGRIFFLSYNDIDPKISIERISISGGKRELIAKNPTSPITVSPDGSRVAFVRGSDLIAARIDDGFEQILASRPSKESWFASWGSQLSWAPDGSAIAISAGHLTDGVKRTELLLVHVADGSQSDIPVPAWESNEDVAWMPDMSGLIITARETSGLPYQLWFVPFPAAGEARRITHDDHDYNWLSLNGDSTLIVAGQEIAFHNIWTSPINREGPVKQLTSGSVANDGYLGVAALPDGRIVYTSPRSGKTDLWIMDADGTDQRQLTRDSGANVRPAAGPDGRLIAFLSTRTGEDRIWLMDPEGGSLRQLDPGDGAQNRPIFSPDGNYIYFTWIKGDNSSIWRMPALGGDPVRISPLEHAEIFSLSRDGKFLTFQMYDPDLQEWHIGVMRSDDGRIIRLFGRSMFGRVRMTDDSKAVMYIEYPAARDLWRQPISGGRPSRITNFGSGRLRSFDLMPDGRSVVVSRGQSSNEAVSITNFRPQG
jgi:Tol biopolymer transport system component/DNA-binding winged helix-turn-helix (wHTH) protein